MSDGRARSLKAQGDFATFNLRLRSVNFRATSDFYCLPMSQDAAKAALVLHGMQMAGNLVLNVLISNPERKKDRTDADANDREVYVAGLSKFVTKVDLEKLFKTVSHAFLIVNGVAQLFAWIVRSLERSANDNGPQWPFKGLRLCRVRERGTDPHTSYSEADGSFI